MKRFLRRGLSALLLLAAAAVAGGAVWLSPLLHKSEGTVAVPGVKAPVAIVRDRHGIPHIEAQNEEDAYAAVGFMHARDRFWQMEATRRLGAGRLAEIVGRAALESDKLMRTLGLARLAEEQWRHLGASARRALEAYARGVNAWMNSHGGALSPETVVLRYDPVPWRPVDSLIWGKLMGLRLTLNWRRELLRAELLEKMPEAKVRDLWAPADETVPASVSDNAAFPRRGKLFALLARIFGPFPGASNAWAIAGKRTKSGEPILANDPHLRFGLPILWYLARVETPKNTVLGATVPGLPFHILGQNRDIAWGLTTTQSDTSDLFIERIDPEDSTRYLTPAGSQPFTVRREIIEVAGADPVTIRVRRTRHGPVVSDLFAATDPKIVYALSATFLGAEDRTPEAIHELNRARDWDSFLDAMRLFRAPQQNLLYADRHGNIGFLTVGLTPIRRRGDGWSPVPGWDGNGDWTGFIPFADMPRSLNPPAGVLVNANNKVIGGDYPYFLSHDWAPGYRARRLHERLAETENHDLSDSARLQTDGLSLMARTLSPIMREGLAGESLSANARATIRTLEGWDGAMAPDRSEPLIFNAWLRELVAEIAADELGESFRRYWSPHPLFVHRVLTRKQAWCDDVATPDRVERCAEALRAALERALEKLARRFGKDMKAWRWGAAHRIALAHPIFGRVPLLSALVNRSVETGGGQYTVNQGGYRYGRDETAFENRHGAGYRAVYDLGDPARSRFMIATGQSGNPLSPLYDDFIDAWKAGRFITLGDSNEARVGGRGVLRLVPAP